MKRKSRAKKPPIEVGDILQGKQVLAIERREKGATGRLYQYADFYCDCKRRFSLNLQMLSVARAGKIKLHCQVCQDRAKAKQLQESYRKNGKTTRASKPVNYRPKAELLPETAGLMRSLTSKQLKAAQQIIRAHLKQCLASGAPIENFDRICKEAAELAKIGDKLPVTEWTPENCRDGLDSRRYEHYFGGIG